MKKLICLVFILNLFQCISLNSQNLVPNCSFEITTSCAGYGKIYYAAPWFQPNIYSGNTTNSSSSDMFASCAPSFSGVSVPSNSDGYQYARTGSVYVGIYCFRTTNSREYIEVPLLDTLISNHNYCVEYYVSYANNWGTVISNMGAYFSHDSVMLPKI